MPIITVQYSYELDQEIKNNKRLLVMFSASWCKPCANIKPTIENISNEYKNTKFVHVDIDDADEICGEYKIRVLPTFIMYVDGVIYERKETSDSSIIRNMLIDKI